ncbi:Lrp/AsnC family transcriptional regulator [Candidatus Pacearchaeota archaeon]|nr:Lrp/AsnC family transcriptional regulator [Candidatus Pacearchaeota archaeon]
MEIKLTKADKIILRNVEYNARIFEKELARKCNLSKDSIRYRINRLKKLGVITGTGAFIDYTALGYSSYKLYLKLSATNEQKEELRKYLGTQKQIFAIFESSGNWDIAIAVFAKTRGEYYEFENNLLSKFGNLIYSKDFCLMIDAVLLQNNLIIHENQRDEFPVWGGKIVDVDAKDKILMNELHRDGKQNLLDLGGRAKLSIDSVSRRIKRLVKSKVIPFFSTSINYNKLGFEKYKLFIYVKNYSNDVEEKILDFLRTNKHTLNYIKMIGPWKLEVEFLVKNHDEFENILSLIQENFPDIIQKLEFSIFRNEVWFPCEKLLV